MPTRAEALRVLRSLQPALAARGVRHAALFGSVARGEASARSDIDIVVTMAEDRRADLIDLGGVQTLLEEGFGGAPVDVVIAPVRKPMLRAAIERDRVDAF